MIDVNSLSIIDGKGNRLLRNLNLKIHEDKTTLICGEPGSGKTLLLKALTGLIPEGMNKKGSVKKEGNTGLVFQNPEKQIVRSNVRMEAAFDLENRSLPRNKIVKRIEKYADLISAEHLLDRDIQNLSHGETTKAALLSVLVREPEIVLFDEPLSSLDYSNQKLLLDSIDRLRETGTTVVIAEHDLRDLVQRSDRAIILKDGEIVENCRVGDAKGRLYKEGLKLPFDWELEIAEKRGTA